MTAFNWARLYDGSQKYRTYFKNLRSKKHVTIFIMNFLCYYIHFAASINCSSCLEWPSVGLRKELSCYCGSSRLFCIFHPPTAMNICYILWCSSSHVDCLHFQCKYAVVWEKYTSFECRKGCISKLAKAKTPGNSPFHKIFQRWIWKCWHLSICSIKSSWGLK